MDIRDASVQGNSSVKGAPGSLEHGLQNMVLVFAIPFSHPMIAMRSLMFGNSGIVIAGIIYEAIFAAVTMSIAVSLFKKDIVLTGMPKRKGKKSVWSSLIHYQGKK